MKCFCGLVVVGILVLFIDVSLGQKLSGRNPFNWRSFFNVREQQPSTPKPPPFEDTKVNYDSNENLFDVNQFRDNVLGLEKTVLTEEESNKIPAKPKALAPTVYCQRELKEALDTFCTNMAEGEYYDPWNPFCGFIRCTRRSHTKGGAPSMVATRELCKAGTWVSDSDTKMRHGRDMICRFPINVSDGDKCMGGSIYKRNRMCEPARRVLKMNDKNTFY